MLRCKFVLYLGMYYIIIYIYISLSISIIYSRHISLGYVAF